MNKQLEFDFNPSPKLLWIGIVKDMRDQQTSVAIFGSNTPMFDVGDKFESNAIIRATWEVVAASYESHSILGEPIGFGLTEALRHVKEKYCYRAFTRDYWERLDS